MMIFTYHLNTVIINMKVLYKYGGNFMKKLF